MTRQEARVEKHLNAAALFFISTGIIVVSSYYVWREFYVYPLSSRSVLLIVILSALTVSLLLKRKKRILAFLVLFSAAMGLFALNLIVDIFMPMTSAVRTIPPGFDTRSKYEVVQSFRNQGLDAVPHICPSQIYSLGFGGELLPLSGFANRFTVYCNESGTFASYTTDRHGFRNPDSVYDNFSNSARLMLLGDSFTDGACVLENHDLGSKLRHIGQPTVNLGCGGNGPLAAMATWAEYNKIVNPKVVVWLYYEHNDIPNLSEEKNTMLVKYMDSDFSQNLVRRRDDLESHLNEVLSEMEKKYLKNNGENEGGRNWRRRKLIDKAETRRRKAILSYQLSLEARRFGTSEDALKHLTLFNILTLHSVRNVLGLTSIGVDLGLFAQVFVTFKNRIERESQKLLFVYIPSFTSLQSGGRRSLFPTSYEDFKPEVMKIVGSANVSILDFEEILLSQKDPQSYFPLYDANHFSKEGYALLANSIKAKIREVSVQ